MESYDNVEDIIRDIASVKIQGARNVAKASIKALSLATENYVGNDPKELAQHLLKLRENLLSIRVTEPMTRNLIEAATRHVISYATSTSNIEKFKEFVKKNIEELLASLYDNYENMTMNGAKHIEEGSTVMTICHSSSVTGILKKAKKELGKEFSVISCETRPLFQGRITAKELVGAGIKTTTIVDSAAATYIKEADIVLVGADAITSEGDLYNKIGTKMMSILAEKYNVPFYSAAELFKFDRLSLFGRVEPIEMRAPEEVWPEAPHGLTILNPAFDKTPAKRIAAYITDKGILPPQRVGEVFEEEYRV
ncbi:MAG: hypothetical protein D6769_02010 [Methanobacteriota archaeon]|nr:MAG: hypothetical protein D6769_02010 [Euryarchaeota archaeon]